MWFDQANNILFQVSFQGNSKQNKTVAVERKNSSEQNNIGQLKIKNYSFERAENCKYLAVTLNEDKQICFQKIITNANKTHFVLQIVLRNKTYHRNKTKNKEHNTQNVNMHHASET
jgi:hypothetical protein